MLAFAQQPYVIRQAAVQETGLIAYLRMASLVSLEMPRHSLDAVRTLMAGIPDVDAADVAAGRYYVADHGGDLIGGVGWSVLPLQFRSERLANEDGGAAFLSLDAGSVLLRGFFLDPDLGRRGVAPALLKRIEADVAQEGYGACEGVVPADAQITYRSLGFKPVRKLRIRMDDGERFPVLQMRRSVASRLAAAA